MHLLGTAIINKNPYSYSTTYIHINMHTTLVDRGSRTCSLVPATLYALWTFNIDHYTIIKAVKEAYTSPVKAQAYTRATTRGPGSPEREKEGHLTSSTRAFHYIDKHNCNFLICIVY